MRKIMRKKISILLVLFLALGWYETIGSVFGKSAEAERQIAAAEAYEKKEIYEDALEAYRAALALDPKREEVSRKIAEMHLRLGDTTAFIAACESLIYQEKTDEDALRMLVDYYGANGKKKDAVFLLRELKESQKDNESVDALWKQYRGYYEELYFSCEELFPYYGGYAVAGNGGSYGIVDTEGNSVIALVYEKAGYFSTGELQAAPVVQDGSCFYLNKKGRKKIVPDEAYEELGVLSENRIAVKKGGKAGYVDASMTALAQLEWEEATAFREGVAAVRKGGKWALIGDDFSLLTEYVFDDVAVGEAGFCCGQKRIFARTADGFCLLNEKGEPVGEQLFEAVRPFEEEVTAVCVNGSWGFIDTDGAWVIEPAYEDAYPFAHGLAPVKYKDGWGYIDLSGETVVGAEFEAAYPFNGDGTAPVKRGESWSLIRLYAVT